MTSKISFFNFMRENIKQRIGSIVISILICFISFPLALLLILENMKAVMEPDYMEIFIDYIGISPQSIFVIGIIAVICGISGFSYLFSKTKVDFYHSLPVKREKIFLASYLNGIFIYVLPYLICMGICLIISVSYIGFSGLLLKITILNILTNIIYYLFLYHIVIISVVLTGNKISCFLMLFVLIIYVIATKGICFLYQKAFFYTFYSGDILLENAKFTSPIFTMIYGIQNWMGQIKNGNIEGGKLFFFLFQTFILSGCSGILGFWLFKKRTSESAGKSIAFPMIQDIYRILLVIPSSLGSGIFFAAISNNKGLWWFIFGIFFGMILSHCLLEILFHMDIRGAFSHKIQLCVTAGFLLFFVISMKFDWWGYDNYLPKENKIKSMAIKIAGINDISYYDEEQKKFYQNFNDYILENMEITDYEPIYEIIEENIEHQSYWDYKESARYNTITVKYNLTNGKEAYRQYRIEITEDSYKKIKQILENEDYKKTIYQIFTLDEKNIIGVNISDIEGNQSISLNKEKMPEFLSIYRKELERLTFDEMKENYPVGEVMFNYNGHYLMGYYIYPSFTETINYLQEHDLKIEPFIEEFDADKIEEIKVACYEWNMQVSAEEVPSLEYDRMENVFIKEYRKKEEIEQLCQNLKPSITRMNNYNYNWFFSDSAENNILVKVVWTDEDGNLKVRNGYYPEKYVPEIIEKDFKLQVK